MLETAEIGRTVNKEEYEARLPGLRVDLLNAQFDLRDASFPVLLLVAGDDQAGCNQVVNLLHEWLDARYLLTHAFARPTEDERERPRFWRYWHALPGRGQLALFVGAWPRAAIADRFRGRIRDDRFERRLEHIARFEQALADDGALLLKFWLHLPRKELGRRLQHARRSPDEHWRLDGSDEAIYRRWKRVMTLVERLLAHTSTGEAPWYVIESTDERYRNLEIGEILLRRLRERQSATRDAAGPSGLHEPSVSPEVRDGLLARVDLSASLSTEKYEPALASWQRRLRKEAARVRKKGASAVVLFEGWDAAGKGGAIRRITAALDATDYRVVPIAAPTEEEHAHHYLWRFWRHLPREGRLVLFDRSWYGRVLVERVEGFATEAEWMRAYAEIRDFEEQITEHGMPVVKFWLHIDAQTQLERFRARESTPYKKYKITGDDYRNRDRWDEYALAVEEMVARTSTESAPWHLVPANDKRFARVQVLESLVGALRRATR